MRVVPPPRVSADGHLNEPHDLWYSRLPADLRDGAPRQIQDAQDGGWSLVVNGDDEVGIGRRNLETWETLMREAAASPQARLQMMLEDCVTGGVIHPTIGLFAYRIEDPAIGAASCRVYNDWIYERLGDASPRIKLTALIPTWDVEGAVAEVERAAALPSFGGLMLPIVGTPHWNHRQWEPLWGAIEAGGTDGVAQPGTLEIRAERRLGRPRGPDRATPGWRPGCS